MGDREKRSQFPILKHLSAWAAATATVEPAAAWIRQSERAILGQGVPLHAHELEVAASLGVVYPEAVRLLEVDAVPVPGHRLAHLLGRAAPQGIAGLTAGYGIYLIPAVFNDPEIRIHELVHVGQYDRLGLRPFLWHYTYQCLVHGYADAPLEREAVDQAAQICRSRNDLSP